MALSPFVVDGSIRFRDLTKNNVVIGDTLFPVDTTTISNGVVLGTNALKQGMSGSSPIAIGFNAMGFADNAGSDNICIGPAVGQWGLGDYENIAIGSSTAMQLETGWRNILIGKGVFQNQTNASLNVSIGAYSMHKWFPSFACENNVALGVYAGYQANEVERSTFIGANAGSALQFGENVTVIGYNAQASSYIATNEITLGNLSVTSLRCKVTTITTISDERDKADIEDNELGLDFIKGLRTRRFKYDCREWYFSEEEDSNGFLVRTPIERDGSLKEDVWTEGFVAQELQPVIAEHNAEWLRLVDESNPDKLEASSHKVLIPLVKAVQELSAQIDDLQGQLAAMQNS